MHSTSRRLQPFDDISIIVVDDAKFTLEMIRRVLAKAGFQDIRVALSGAEALRMMRQRKANILVADWMMPEMDGLSLTQHVRQFDEENDHYTYNHPADRQGRIGSAGGSLRTWG